jgi:transposase
VSEIARRFRVGEDRVRGWIRSGALRAINTADVRCGRPRFVALPEHLAEFERGRSAAAPPRAPKRPRRRPDEVDYFPD